MNFMLENMVVTVGALLFVTGIAELAVTKLPAVSRSIPAANRKLLQWVALSSVAAGAILMVFGWFGAAA